MTGIRLSDSSLARYSPPQSRTIHYQADTDGQLSIFDAQVEYVDEPPDPNDYDLLADFQDAYDRWMVTNPINEVLAENNEANTTGISTESVGADEIVIDPELPADRDNSSKPDGTRSYHQNEGVGSSKGDRLLEESGPDSRSAGGVPSHQPPELVSDAILDYLRDIGHKTPVTPKAAFNDEQPPNRGDGRKFGKLGIGIQVGHRIDLRALGTIRNIYTSKKGKLRAKIERIKKAGEPLKAAFVYVDCDRLIEQQFIPYDHPQPLGPWKNTGNTVVFRSDICDVWVRKEKPPAPTNWTAADLMSMSLLSLKAIARDMAIFSIPGTGKRSLIRAILVEQAIASEKRQLTEIKTTATKTDDTPHQLTLNLFTAAA